VGRRVEWVTIWLAAQDQYDRQQPAFMCTMTS